MMALIICRRPAADEPAPGPTAPPRAPRDPRRRPPAAAPAVPTPRRGCRAPARRYAAYPNVAAARRARRETAPELLLGQLQQLHQVDRAFGVALLKGALGAGGHLAV